MHKVYLRFYEELNDFLPEEKRKKRFTHHYIDRTSVKDLIESIGIPHTEVDLILIDGKSVDFNYLINDGDDISVYPVFESLDISDVQHLRQKPLREPKFICDVHLGKLARYLRILGFDAAYENNLDAEEIIKISLKEKRVILTKDKGILKRNEVTHGYYVRNVKVEEQVKEIIKRFDLHKETKEFTRCLECNSELTKIAKEKIAGILPPKVNQSHQEFCRCPGCGKLYWKGTHHKKMLSFVQRMKTMNSD